MSESLRLGRIAGVPVGVNWSVLVIFLLITVGLAAGQFPAAYPDRSETAYAIAGLSAGIVFFASLLAHELSHAIVARRNGVDVEGITLWLFGGVARLSGEAADPGADFRIAGVGPLVSIVAGAMFGAIAAGLHAAGATGLLVGVFVWLAFINIVLAVFNLVPAAPLDGGRILRALLWRRSGDRFAAALTAARAGRGFGWFLVIVGITLFVLGGVGGLWMALIGWFLTHAAAAEAQHAEVSGALTGVRVVDVMTPDPVVAPADLTVDRFVEEYVFQHRHSTFPLIDAWGAPTGLVTLARVKQVPPDRRSSTTAQQVACPVDELALAAPEDDLIELLPRMSACADGRALVVRSGRLVGIVSPTDVMRRLEVADLGRDAPRPRR